MVDAKTHIDDFEADLIIGAGHKGGILVLLEQRTGGAVAEQEGAHDGPRRRALLKDRVRTITFDSGREFSQHRRVARALECECYFTNPYSSWLKGAVENANGLRRGHFPRKMSLGRESGCCGCCGSRVEPRPPS